VKETIVRLVDDIDGGAADETVTFTFDGVAYEIDLSRKNAKALKNAVAPFIGSARKAGGARTVAKKTPARAAAKLDLAAIREWAVTNGHAISNRGRIPAAVVDAFHAFQSGVQADPATPAKTTAATKSAPARKSARKVPAKKTAAANKAVAKAPAKKAAVKKAAPAKKVTAKKVAPKKVAARKAAANTAAPHVADPVAVAPAVLEPAQPPTETPAVETVTANQ
jgi:Lsr2